VLSKKRIDNAKGFAAGPPQGETRPPGGQRPAQRWSVGVTSLPRDTRDTLFLLAVIGWIAFMQIPHVPAWCSALTAGVLGWRTAITLRGQPLPGWPWRLGLLLLTLAATWFSHRTLLGRDAGVTLIVVLLALKTLELRARRDAFVVFFLGFFTLLTHFFFSQSLLTAAGILIALLGLLTALVNAHLPVGRPPLMQSARTAAGMAALGAPIMLVLFLLFPRMAPLWGLPSDANTGRSGLSNRMQVGQIAQLVLDDAIAMRIRFEGDPPPQRDLYFRGPVLSDFNGIEWRPLRPTFPADMAPPTELVVSGDPVRYEVTLEPHRRRWLLTLDAATQAPRAPGLDAGMTPELQWLAAEPLNQLLRYSAQSHTRFRYGPRERVLALQDDITLPPGYNPRTLALAVELRAQHGPGPQHTAELVEATLDRLRTGGYQYTLEPGEYGQHTADEFWFDKRAGFCEHIASSFVILMRAMDIPARLVTGYQGGELNGVDGYWTVRQRDAHAWAEVWLQGQGWVRVDPTSAVAPGRTGSLDRLSTPGGALAGAIGTLNPTLAAQLRNAWEAVNNRWNQWVLNYTQGQQLNLLRNLGFSSPSWADLAYVLIGIVVLVSLVGAGWQLWERQQHDPWLRLLQRCQKRLQVAGLPDAAATPRALAAQVQRHFGDTPFSRNVTQWLIRLEALRYAAQSPDTLATLRRDWKNLEWPTGGTA
jgi:transglutaminase-like putative cysteine protease